MTVKVVGKGCDKYFYMLGEVKKIAKASKKDIQVIEITNGTDIAKLGVRNLPALIVDGKICNEGTNMDREVIKEMLAG